MIEFVSGALAVITYICMGIGVIFCTIFLIALAGLVFLEINESGFINFLRELRNK